MADEIAGLRCRNCGNTGISPWTGEPCGCRHGKALAHLVPQQPVQANETVKVWAERPHVHPVETLEYGVYFTGEHGEPDELAAMFYDRQRAEEWARERSLPTAVRMMAQYQEPRAIVRHFAAAMERKLAANDGIKGGWRAATTQADMRRWKALQHIKALREEVAELEDALIRMDSLRREVNAEQVQDILMEACDCALYALMIADVVGALPQTDERGR